jgi:hypothetical protein
LVPLVFVGFDLLLDSAANNIGIVQDGVDLRPGFDGTARDLAEVAFERIGDEIWLSFIVRDRDCRIGVAVIGRIGN